MTTENIADNNVIRRFLSNADEVHIVRNNPSHPLDVIQGPVIYLMQKFSPKKETCWWHFNSLPKTVKLQNGVIIPADPNSSKVDSKNPLRRQLQWLEMSTGGWDQYCIVDYDYERLQPGTRPLLARLAYIEEVEGEILRAEFCSRVIKPPFAVLLGNHPVRVGLIGEDDFISYPTRTVGPFPVGSTTTL